jgi:hypothetical protein
MFGLPVPNFAPNFDDNSCGEFGHRQWYDYHMFWAQSIESEMCYDSVYLRSSLLNYRQLTSALLDHRTRLRKIHETNNVSISKVTHGGRSYAATTARSHGATETGTKAMGGWNENGAFRACYDRALPVDALLGAAMFNGRKPETYFVARDKLGVS